MSVLFFLWNPELAEREVAGGVCVVKPVDDFYHSGVVDGACVKTVHAGREYRFLRDAGEVVTVEACRQAEVSFLFGFGFVGPIEYVCLFCEVW